MRNTPIEGGASREPHFKHQELALQRKPFHLEYRYSANRFLKKPKAEKTHTIHCLN